MTRRLRISRQWRRTRVAQSVRTARRGRPPLVLAIALCASTALPALAADAGTSLSALITTAQRDNQDLRAARYEVALGRVRLEQAGLLANPRLNIGGGGDIWHPSSGAYNASLGVSQEFPVAGRVAKQRAVARIDIALALSGIDDAERRLAGDVAASAYRLLVIDRQLQLADEQLAVDARLARVTRSRFTAAEVSELDVNAVDIDAQRRAFIAGANLSVAAGIGFITLFGIAARNGIILVSHYHHLRGAGYPLQEVVVRGTIDRLVPVLMTALTAALGLLPLLFGSPVGKELEVPLAQVVLGGLLSATLLNMLVVPTVYNRIEQWRARRERLHAPTRSSADVSS